MALNISENIKVTIIRSNRKTLSIQLKPGEIIARAPLRMKDKEIYSFIESKKAWIEKHLAAISERQRVLDEMHPFTEDEIKTSVSCFNHYINTAALREIVLFTIREISVYAISNREEFIEKVRQASAVKQEQVAKELRRQLNKDKKRLTELDFLYKKLYEAYAIGKIPEDKFEFLFGEYLAEQTELQNSIAENEVEICKYEDDTARVGQFLELAEKYTDFTELTTPMINEFIDKILVHSADRNNGPRTQEVEIYLKFIGQFEIPQREPTEEELEQMRIKKYWQDRYWKHRDYELNRRKKQKEKAKAEEISDFSPKMQENVVQ